MKSELRVAERGEFMTTTGECHLEQARRRLRGLPLIDFRLAGAGDPAVTIQATGDISKFPAAFASEFDDGIAAFVMRHRLRPLHFEIHSVRKISVAAGTPFKQLRPDDLFHALIVLDFAPEQGRLGAVDR